MFSRSDAASSGAGGPTLGVASNLATDTLTLASAAAGGSRSDAYDLALTDAPPRGVAYVSGSLEQVSGPAADSLQGSGASPAIGYNDLAPGGTAVFTFQGVLQGATGPYQTLTDTATAAYTTLPGPVTSVNDLDASGSASVTTVLPKLQ